MKTAVISSLLISSVAAFAPIAQQKVRHHVLRSSLHSFNFITEQKQIIEEVLNKDEHQINIYCYSNLYIDLTKLCINRQ